MNSMTGYVSRLVALALLMSPHSARAEIESVLAHPPFDAFYLCGEHFAGQFDEPGDALGTDCEVHRLTEVDGRAFSRAYRGDGRSNAQWFGWNEPVLSPCTCSVEALHENPVTNEPGMLGEGPASYLILRRDDGTRFMLAHIQTPSVAEGDRVTAGQPVARVGNNGYSRAPHLHIGAWRGETALQIRWDQTRMRLPPEFRMPQAP